MRATVSCSFVKADAGHGTSDIGAELHSDRRRREVGVPGSRRRSQGTPDGARSSIVHGLHDDDGRPPLDHALSDGEDFELVFTVSPADGERLLQAQPVPDIALTWIGEIIETGYWLERGGKRVKLEPRGYEHSLSQASGVA